MYKIFVYDEDPEAGFTETIDENSDEEMLDFIVPLLDAYDEDGFNGVAEFVSHWVEEQYDIKLPAHETS